LSAHRRVFVEQSAKQPVLIEREVRRRLMINAGEEPLRKQAGPFTVSQYAEFADRCLRDESLNSNDLRLRCATADPLHLQTVRSPAQTSGTVDTALQYLVVLWAGDFRDVNTQNDRGFT
jgi:hypothetical protein